MRLRSKAADLAKRVNAGVGASGGMYNDVLLRQAPKHANDFPLNRRLVRLNLPAVEISAVVRDGELEIAHGNQVISFQFSVFSFQSSVFRGGRDWASFKKHYGAVRTKRLPGFTATLPPRQSGQSSSS